MFFFYLLLFLIWPFFAFVFALFKCESRIVKMLVVVGFTAIIGANMYYINVPNDSARYASHFMEDVTYGVDLSDFISQGRIDILYPLSNLFVAQFTSNPRILLSLYGMLYGLLIFLSISKVYDIFHRGNALYGDMNFQYNKVSAIFILVMIYFSNPITNLPTFRFWFSAWLFFYGWLIYTEGKTRKGIIFMLLTPLMHTAFVLPLLILAIHKYVSIPTKVLFWGVILCFIIGQILYVQDYMQEISYITDSEKYDGYIQAEAYEENMEMAERRSIINEFSIMIYKYIFFGIILYLYSVISRIKTSEARSKLISLYNFILLIFCFAYLFVQVPSMGRFLFLGYMFLLFFIGIMLSVKILPHKRILLVLISVAMLGKIFLSLFPQNISIFDIRYLYPIFYL